MYIPYTQAKGTCSIALTIWILKTNMKLWEDKKTELMCGTSLLKTKMVSILEISMMTKLRQVLKNIWRKDHKQLNFVLI